MVKVTEMPRGPQKKITKAKAYKIAADCLQHALAKAYYDLDSIEDYEYLSEEEQQIVNEELDRLANKMAKAIGRDYYTI